MLNVDISITTCYGKWLACISRIDEGIGKSPCQRQRHQQD